MFDTIIIQQEMTFFEMLNAVLYLVLNMRIVKRLVLFYLIMIMIKTILDMILLPPGKTGLSQICFDLLVIPVCLFLCFALLAVVALAATMILKPDLFKNAVYKFSHWGLEVTRNGAEFTRPWGKFLSVRESNHFIFLYISENNAHIIQKRMFANDVALDWFRQLIKQKLSS